MGCAAIRKFKPLQQVMASRLTLLEGDAREWAQLASKAGLRCNKHWAFFLGAKCFRDSLLHSVAKAIAVACPPGVRVAVLGRKFPAGHGFIELQGGAATYVPTSWNK